MRFVTNEGEFGILLAKASADGSGVDPAMTPFRFQLLLGGHLIGDAVPCVPGPAFGGLRKPCRVDAAQVGGFPADPGALGALLSADAQLFDRTRAPLAASLEGWSSHVFVSGSRVALLAWAGTGPVAAEVFSAFVGIDEYYDVVGCAFEYWNLVRMNVPRFF